MTSHVDHSRNSQIFGLGPISRTAIMLISTDRRTAKPMEVGGGGVMVAYRTTACDIHTCLPIRATLCDTWWQRQRSARLALHRLKITRQLSDRDPIMYAEWDWRTNPQHTHAYTCISTNPALSVEASVNVCVCVWVLRFQLALNGKYSYVCDVHLFINIYMHEYSQRAGSW